MKLIYKKPPVFPTWAIFDNKNAGKQYYAQKVNGVCFSVTPDKLPHTNHIEMTGFEASSILSYKIDKQQKLHLYKFCVYPQIRVIPNETRGSLSHHFKNVTLRFSTEKSRVTRVFFDGILQIDEQAGNVTIQHRFATAFDKKALIEEITICNHGKSAQPFVLKADKKHRIIKKRYLVKNADQVLYTTIFDGENEIPHSTAHLTVDAEQEKHITVVYGAEKLTLTEAEAQIRLRKQFMEDSRNRLKIKTPNDQINQMLEFCKVRASECIFNTKNGLMHAPCGGQYYGALWTNDQCEYANPLFAYLGYPAAKEEAENSYRLFSKFASAEKAIPTSIVACGDDIWNGAGDRGDSSMFLYGLCRYLLSTGDKETARTFLPSIKAAAEYVAENITEEGIVKSDSDELENRFESGNANLSTACITYDAFLSLHYLYGELGDTAEAQRFLQLANQIKNGIETYFGAEVEGYNTYRYCKEEPNLRAWICLPLTVGIDTRRSETVRALLSDRLLKTNGILTRSGTKTYWDRATLYALRGLFYVGETEKANQLLTAYTKERLLGCHPPYPVEAFPEGNSAQLSAESALYLRIFTEGILGYRPTGFHSFELKPNLPQDWDFIEIGNIELGDKTMDIAVQNGDEYTVTINGACITVPKGEAYTYSILP